MEGEGTGYNLIYEISSRDSKAFPELLSEYDSTTVIQYSGIRNPEVVQLIDFVSQNYQLAQKEYIVLGIVGQHQKILSTLLGKELQLSSEERLRPYVEKLLEQSILISRGVKKGTEYLINPKLIESARINIKPTLKVIEPHVLSALILEDLKLHPGSKSSAIQKRISDLPIEDIRRCLIKLEKEGKILSNGSKRGKLYLPAKKN